MCVMDRKPNLLTSCRSSSSATVLTLSTTWSSTCTATTCRSTLRFMSRRWDTDCNLPAARQGERFDDASSLTLHSRWTPAVCPSWSVVCWTWTVLRTSSRASSWSWGDSSPQMSWSLRWKRGTGAALWYVLSWSFTSWFKYAVSRRYFMV